MSTPHSSAAAGQARAAGREEENRAEKPAGAESLLTHARRSLRSKISAWSTPALDAGIRLLQSLRQRLCGNAGAGEERHGTRKERMDEGNDKTAQAPAAPARHRLRSALVSLGLLLAGGAGGGALAHYLRAEPVVVAAAVPAAAGSNTSKAAQAGPEEAPAEAADSGPPTEGAPAASAEVNEQLEEARAARIAAEKKLAAALAASAKAAVAQQKKLELAEKNLALLRRGSRPAQHRTGRCDLDSGNLNALKDCIAAFNR